MKKLLLITLLINILTPLFSEEPTLSEKMEAGKVDWKDLNYEFYISPVVLPEVGIGVGQRSMHEKFCQEGIVILHADLIPSIWELRYDAKEFYKIRLWGVKYKSTYFYKPDYSGFNWFFNVGFQTFYADLNFGSPGGSVPSSNPRWHGFPDLAVGCGYSWKLKNDNYFRVSLDAGIKLILSNLYFSYVW